MPSAPSSTARPCAAAALVLAIAAALALAAYAVHLDVGALQALAETYHAARARISPPQHPRPNAPLTEGHANVAYREALSAADDDAVRGLRDAHARMLSAHHSGAVPPSAAAPPASCRALGMAQKRSAALSALTAQDCARLGDLDGVWAALDRACHSAHHHGPRHPASGVWRGAQREEALVALLRLGRAAHVRAWVDLHSGRVQRGLERWACTARLAQDLGQAPDALSLAAALLSEDLAWATLHAALEAMPAPLTRAQWASLHDALAYLSKTTRDTQDLFDVARLGSHQALTHRDPLAWGLHGLPDPITRPTLQQRLTFRARLNTVRDDLAYLARALSDTPGSQHTTLGSDALGRDVCAPWRALPTHDDAPHTLIARAMLSGLRLDMLRLRVADARLTAARGSPASRVDALHDAFVDLPKRDPFYHAPYAFARDDGREVIQTAPIHAPELGWGSVRQQRAWRVERLRHSIGP